MRCQVASGDCWPPHLRGARTSVEQIESRVLAGEVGATQVGTVTGVLATQVVVALGGSARQQARQGMVPVHHHLAPRNNHRLRRETSAPLLRRLRLHEVLDVLPAASSQAQLCEFLA
eukprot:SAG31_NODE_4303_length_3370_cov_1.742281_6_plen_117_part_00